MKRMTDRRTILLAAGTTAAAAVASGVVAQSPDIRGTVTYEGGAPIPKGRINLAIEGAAVAKAAGSATQMDSDGKAGAVEFSMSLPARASAAPTEIVATLERADGWLLARGSAPFTPGEPVAITMYAVMY
ncbi:hypothetical protein [Paracoccus xiamenensis]|uniref:hypothetical protein n=1 Tax=Paracoccus xiamenensis TaxID=2714901 RepID=UPI001409B425|nr:hypothetical protein [Paracoccus xiamenensis]NHF73491.1 hypothetical protein [Paracoccus xiamenensis]